MNKIIPKINTSIKNLLKHEDFLFRISNLHTGPVHILFPQIFSENIETLKRHLDSAKIKSHIYFAHKPNKSKVFVKQAYDSGIGIDVSSVFELTNALLCGFTGERIICTGIKTKEFIFLALAHNCRIIVDSVAELEDIIYVHNIKKITNKANLILRIEDVHPDNSNLQLKSSIYGISKNQLEICWGYFEKNKNILLLGFHFHKGQDLAAEQRGEIINDMVNLIRSAHERGFNPEYIDIGGGLRTNLVEDYRQWEKYLEYISENLMIGKPIDTWDQFSFGLSLNQKSRISGKERALALISNVQLDEYLKEIFNVKSHEQRPLHDFLIENDIQILLEPGNALLDQAGISLLKVLRVKKNAEGDYIVATNANQYNLSGNMFEHVTDPILISKNLHAQDSAVYITGNTCRTSDLLLKRKITFNTLPQEGDLICFVNTASYKSDFEDASPHGLAMGKKFVVPDLNTDQPEVISEENYVAQI